jgi:acyl-CoA thioesterase
VSEFDVLTHLETRDDGTLVGAIPPRWDIGGNVNGGALLAIAAAGLRSLAARPDPVSVTAHYLAPGREGPVEMRGEVVKAGRQFASVAGALRQGDRDLLRVVGTFGDLAAMADGYEHVTGPPPELAPPESCVARSMAAPDVAFQEKLRLLLDPSCAGFFTGAKSGRAEMRAAILEMRAIAAQLPPSCDVHVGQKSRDGRKDITESCRS